MQLESVLDNVAADVLYHRSCYQAYTQPKELRRLTDSQEEDHDNSPFQSAFQALVKEIEETILNENDNGVHICRMPDLCNRFAFFLTKEGITDHTSYRTEKLKRRLRLHFGNRLTFYQPTGRSACIVHAANAPAHNLAQAISSSSFGAALDISDSATLSDLEDLPDFDLIDFSATQSQCVSGRT